jgi:hypothetical protein
MTDRIIGCPHEEEGIDYEAPPVRLAGSGRDGIPGLANACARGFQTDETNESDAPESGLKLNAEVALITGVLATRLSLGDKLPAPLSQAFQALADAAAASRMTSAAFSAIM